MLLSATVPPPVQRLAQRYMREPENLDFSPQDITVDTIDQYYFTVEQGRKLDLLLRLLKQEQPKQTIIFCRTKRQTDRDCKRKTDQDTIHGEEGVLDERAIEHSADKRACNFWQRRQERGRKDGAAGNRFVERGGHKQRDACTIGRSRPLSRVVHDIIPQRTTVNCSSR